jgi:CubicO group peptidase (beta-lactamase class C family)
MSSPSQRRLLGTIPLASLVLACVGLCSSGSTFNQEQAPPESDKSVANLDSLLEPIRAKHNLPALASAVVRDGRLIAQGAVGLRSTDSAEPVSIDDLWHIGSCTKAFTSTLVALLVEEGKLSWTTTIGEVFPDLVGDIRPEYVNVTVEQLLGHRSGLPTDRRPDPDIRSKLRSFTGSIQEQRLQVVRLVLQQEPGAPAGTKTLYSNFGYTVVGAIAEKVGSSSWEDQVRDHLFVPLGMKSAGFGAPGTAEAVTQPRGHRRGAPIEPGPFADNAPVISPAGSIHISLADWAKFAVLHLAGERGDSGFLQKETFQKLHTPSPGGEVALGWGVQVWPGEMGRFLTHAGSNGRWFARIVMVPKANLAIIVAINSSGVEAEVATDEVVVTVLRS